MLAPAIHDPAHDPQRGDCLRKDGASPAKGLYRLVIDRFPMQVAYKTSAASVIRVVWLSSWQEWAAGADIEFLLEEERENELDFFTALLRRDKLSCRRVLD